MKKMKPVSAKALQEKSQSQEMNFLGKMFLMAMTALVLLGSCKKDSKETLVDPPPPPVPFPAAEYVSASFEGKVVDESGLPVPGAEVRIGSAATNTDGSGYFKVQNVNVDKHAAFIKVEKDGYFAGARTMIVAAGSKSEARIRLMEKEKSGEFTQAAGGSVSLPDNAGTITFPANAVVDPASGQAYTGTVQVAARFIDPTSENIAEILPGERRAIDNSGAETILRSFATMAVELSGSSAQKLQLGNGKSATLKFPIPASLQAEAPATIPLWYFDETKGLWKEEGTAKKEGNQYVGEVKHFSFWTCDYAHAPVDFEVAFKDESGSPIPSLKVYIKSSDAGDGSVYGYGFTDMAGKLKGKIPSNKNLKIVVENQAGMQLHTQSFVSTTIPKDLGTITLAVAGLPKVTMTGTVKNCADAAVTNGFVAVRLDGQTYRAEITDGTFSLTVPRSSTSATEAILIAYNQGDTKGSIPKTISVTTGSAPVVHLIACTDPAEFINIDLDGTQFLFNDVKNVFKITVNGSTTTMELLIRGREEEYGFTYEMVIGGTTLGSHDLNHLTFGDGIVGGASYYLNTPTTPVKANITSIYEKDGVTYQEGEILNVPMVNIDAHPFTAKKITYKVKVR